MKKANMITPSRPFVQHNIICSKCKQDSGINNSFIAELKTPTELVCVNCGKVCVRYLDMGVQSSIVNYKGRQQFIAPNFAGNDEE